MIFAAPSSDRYSSVTSGSGSRRTRSTRSFPGTTNEPSPSTRAANVVRSESSMSVAATWTSPSCAWTRTPERTCTEPRDETARDTTDRAATRASRSQVTVTFPEEAVTTSGSMISISLSKPFVAVHRECGRWGRCHKSLHQSGKGLWSPVADDLHRSHTARRRDTSEHADSSTVLEPCCEVLDEVVHRSVLTDHPGDLRRRVHHRRVVAVAELTADLRQATRL